MAVIKPPGIERPDRCTFAFLEPCGIWRLIPIEQQPAALRRLGDEGFGRRRRLGSDDKSLAEISASQQSLAPVISPAGPFGRKAERKECNTGGNCVSDHAVASRFGPNVKRMAVKFPQKAMLPGMAADNRRLRSKTQSRAMQSRQQGRRSRAYWLLLAFLVLVFLVGGSSRKEIPLLVLLRPCSVMLAFYAMATTTAVQWRAFKAPLLVMGAIVLLVLAHLVPLPPAVWHGLAGRDLILEIEKLAGQPDVWLPLSMVPGATLNAFYALFTPIAVFFLAMQLDDRDHFWLLVALTGLGLLSALVGVLQGAGINIALYSIMSDTPPGLFANRNHQGAMLAMLFPMLATIAAIGDRYGLDRQFVCILAAAISVALLPLVLVTGSRMGLFVCLIAILMIPALRLELLARNALSGARARWLVGIGVAAVLGVVGLIAARTSRNVAVSRLSFADEDLRFSVWQQVWSFLPEYLPWGSGIGSYVEVYQIHEPPRLLISSYSNHVHNDWLEVVLTAGWPGLMLMVAVVIMFLVAVWRSAGTRGVGAKFNRLGLLMILVLAIASVVDYPLRTPIMAAVFAVATVWSCRPNQAIREFKGKEANV